MSIETVKQHVVPRHYLKGFTEVADPESIFVFRPNQPPIRTGVKGVAFIKNFYTYVDNKGNKRSIEQDLANKIEGPTVPVLAKVRAMQPVTTEDKEILASYMSVMLTRVPKHRKRAEAWLPQVVEQFRNQLPGLLDELLSKSPPAKETREELLEKGYDYVDKFQENPPSQLNVGLVSDKFAPIFANMKWVFFTSPTKRGFVTSDNPIFFFEGLGLVGKDGSSDLVEVTFPISKEVALWATWRGLSRKADFVYEQATEPIVDEFNRRLVSGAMRDVYFGTNPRWLRALVNKDKATLRFNRIV